MSSGWDDGSRPVGVPLTHSTVISARWEESWAGRGGWVAWPWPCSFSPLSSHWSFQGMLKLTEQLSPCCAPSSGDASAFAFWMVKCFLTSGVPERLGALEWVCQFIAFTGKSKSLQKIIKKKKCLKFTYSALIFSFISWVFRQTQKTREKRASRQGNAVGEAKRNPHSKREERGEGDREGGH